jgi:hypothetical protein
MRVYDRHQIPLAVRALRAHPANQDLITPDILSKHLDPELPATVNPQCRTRIHPIQDDTRNILEQRTWGYLLPTRIRRCGSGSGKPRCTFEDRLIRIPDTTYDHDVLAGMHLVEKHPRIAVGNHDLMSTAVNGHVLALIATEISTNGLHDTTDFT